MSDIRIDVVPFDANQTESAIWEINTRPGFGTPVAAMAIICDDADTTPTANMDVGIGFYDGVNQISQCIHDIDGVGTTAIDAAGDDTSFFCYGATNTADITVINRFVATRFIEDGVEIHTDDTSTYGNGRDIRGYIVFFGGASIKAAKAVWVDEGTTSDTISVDVGFKPNLVFATKNNRGAFSTTSSDAFFSLGCALLGQDADAVTQHTACLALQDADTFGGRGDIVTASGVGYAYDVLNAGIGAGSYSYWQIQNLSDSGFDIEKVEDNTVNAQTRDMFFLCLQVDEDVQMRLVENDIPASTTHSMTDIGFMPEFLIGGNCGGPTARDQMFQTLDAQGAALTLWASAGDTLTSMAASSRAGYTSTKSGDVLNTTQFQMLEEDFSQGTYFQSTAFNRTSEGFDFTWNSAPTKTSFGWVLAIANSTKPKTSTFYIPDRHLRAPELLIPGRKPVSTQMMEIDWSNPLTSTYKLQRCFLLNQSYKDLVGGYGIRTLGDFGIDNGGGYYQPAANEFIDTEYYPNNDTCVLVVCKRPAAGTQGWFGVNDGANHRCYFGYDSDNNYRVAWGNSTSSANSIVESVGSINTMFYNPRANNVGVSLFVNQTYANAEGFSAAAFSGRSTTTFSIGYETNSANTWVSPVYFLAIWEPSQRFELTSIESLMSNPYQILKPRGT